ncbi:uncharacterized protein LOC111058419 isoform X2 [Nilaparvata lugens]|uniref:uncharacterized protein LOC111058419 isoform X2 n=1 Tax=Nilaparvata lugens TaxID=108931 RepID=UPI00193E0CC8|nr:uncharacterized protein LOC111058419 isoform X2 [Nilaparvata lugens]
MGRPVIPKSTVEKCFLKCVYKGLGIVANDDTFVLEKIKEILKELLGGNAFKIAENVADICSSEIKVDPAEECSIGKSVRACFVKKGKELSFFPYL